MTDVNTGNITGSVVNVGNNNKGRVVNAGSSADRSVTSRTEVTVHLAELRRVIEKHRSQLAKAEPMLKDVGALEAEVTREEPRRRKLKELLGSLALGAGTVTAVAGAVSAVAEALKL